MTKSQKLTVRLSEIRQKLNDLLGVQGRSDEQNAELETLTAEGQRLEPELRAAIVAESDTVAETRTANVEDAEVRERRALRGRVSLSDYIGAAVAHGDAGRVDGAAREYAAAEGCAGLVPITMLGETAEVRAARNAGVEHRNVTPAPADSDVPSNFAPIVPALFDRSVAPFLGVEMPTVGTGIASYPVLSTSLTGGMKAEDGAADQTAGAFTVTDADPRRLTGSFMIRKEDIAKLPNMEPALRENLSMVLSDEFDKQLVNGNGTAPNLNGVLQQLTDPANPEAGAETYARYQTALSSHIDGLFAVGPMDVRALVGVHTMRHMLGVYRANEDATTAYDMATNRYGGVRASCIADPASNIQQAIIRRANPAGDRVAVAPVWMGMEIIRDVYTKAREGQVQVTGTVLVGGIVLLRSDAFVQDSFRVA